MTWEKSYVKRYHAEVIRQSIFRLVKSWVKNNETFFPCIVRDFSY